MTDAPSGPVIVTERLELWRPTAADVEPMFTITRAPETARYLGNPDFTDHYQRFYRNAGSWLLKGYGAFILRRRGESEPIGNCGVFFTWRGLGPDFDGSPEAGWILRADCVGQGFAGEAMRGALNWFERTQGAQRIVALIDIGNAPSIALAERLGFRAMREAAAPDGKPAILLERLP